jgi:group I intron endonuclease
MKELTYKDFIDNIIATRGRFNCGEEYHESHHVIPKCMGGSDEKNNLVDLFAREHFEAHRLLALENPQNEKIVYAWHAMAFMKNDCHQRYELTSEEFEEVRKAHSAAMSGENNPNYGLTGENHYLYGTHRSEETKNKISEANKGENNGMFGKCHAEEARKKMSNAQKKRFENPENHPRYGKHASEETKMKMSAAFSGESNPACRAVYCYELDEYFWGAREAEQKYGISSCHISSCCRGSRKSCGKHPETGEKLHWIYTDEMNNSCIA